MPELMHAPEKYEKAFRLLYGFYEQLKGMDYPDITRHSWTAGLLRKNTPETMRKVARKSKEEATELVGAIEGIHAHPGEDTLLLEMHEFGYWGHVAGVACGIEYDEIMLHESILRGYKEGFREEGIRRRDATIIPLIPRFYLNTERELQKVGATPVIDNEIVANSVGNFMEFLGQCCNLTGTDPMEVAVYDFRQMGKKAKELGAGNYLGAALKAAKKKLKERAL